jgi:hypothetical protein
VYSEITRRRTSWLLAAIAVAAIAAPVAQAHHAPAASSDAVVPPAAVWTASGREVDRLGPKYVPLQHPITSQPATVVKVVRPAGFDWADAGIGAGATGLALALLAALAVLVIRRTGRTAVPERGDLAGA